MHLSVYTVQWPGFFWWSFTRSSESYLQVEFSLAEDVELTPLLRLGAGACAGIIAMSATYPMDMVRGRLTVQVLFWTLDITFVLVLYSVLGAGCPYFWNWWFHFFTPCSFLQTATSPRQYRGIAHALSTVFREEGPRALYKGWLPSVIGVVSYLVLVHWLLVWVEALVDSWSWFGLEPWTILWWLGFGVSSFWLWDTFVGLLVKHHSLDRWLPFFARFGNLVWKMKDLICWLNVIPFYR